MELESLEQQFLFQPYFESIKREGWILNYCIFTREDTSQYVKIYLVDKNLKNFTISLPFYFSFILGGENLCDIDEFIKQKYKYGFHRSEIVERIDCNEYNHLNKPKKKLLKVYLKYESVYKEAVRNLKRTILQNKNFENIELVYKNFSKEEGDYSIEEQINGIYEYDLPKDVSIANDLNIRSGTWYEICYNGEDYSIEKSNLIVLPELRIFAFDIETTKEPLKFPDPIHDQVMMISIRTESINELITNRNIVSEDIPEFEYTPNDDMKSVFHIYNESNEEALLVRFIEIIQNHKPHIITTFNGFFFDFPFIEKRMSLYDISLESLTGFSKVNDYYVCPFIIHLDCFKWVVRDSYLPKGSQGLKAVTKSKLGYYPDEIDPEDMVDIARKDPFRMASYSVSDAVATYFLYVKYVQTHIFSLSSILPYPPTSILCKGSGTLCEALLITEAINHSILIPESKKVEHIETYNDHIIDNLTYVGGYVESLKSGIFRSDFDHIFHHKIEDINFIRENLDNILEDYTTEKNFEEIKTDIYQKLYKNIGSFKSKGKIFHLDIGAMYPNIILTNRLQPTSIVNDDICIRCDFLDDKNNCKRLLEWEARIDFYAAQKSEIEQVKKNLIDKLDKEHYKEYERLKCEDRDKKFKQNDSYTTPRFTELSVSKQNELLKKSVAEFSKKNYKKGKISMFEKRSEVVCQREIPFYVDSVRKFRDKRYVYKELQKKSIKKVSEARTMTEKINAEKEVSVYSSLQVAHKCVLNSFYGYAMRKNSRWHSTQMAAIVCNIGSNLIKDAKNLTEKIGITLELDTDGIWVIFPDYFPNDYVFSSGKKISFINVLMNYMVCKNYTNPQYQYKENNKYITSSENTLFFEIDGPYKAMIIPTAIEEGKLLKKRYLVINEDNSIAELKGFEIKRNGELEIIKRFQEDLFEGFTKGSSLEECYEHLSEKCNYWLSIITKKGKNVSDEEIFELFSECRKMSKNIKDYEGQSSTLLGAAKKMSEFLGADIIAEKLKVEFIISLYPKDESLSNRAIPILVFKSQNRDEYLKKWCKCGNVNDIRDLIDWDYYLLRLESVIQRIVLLPAILQGLPNPIKNIKLPDWSGNYTNKFVSLGFEKIKKEVIVHGDKAEVKTKEEKGSLDLGVNSLITRNFDSWKSYYKKKKDRNGVIKVEDQKNGNVRLFYYNGKREEKKIKRIIYFSITKEFCLKNHIKIKSLIAPYGTQNIEMACLEINEDDYSKNINSYRNIFNHLAVKKSYHTEISPILNYINKIESISKNPEYCILTSFLFKKHVVYVYSKNDTFYFISDFTDRQIIKKNINDFMSSNFLKLIVINKSDKISSRLSSFLKECNVICVNVEYAISIGGLNTLLEDQKRLHQNMVKEMDEMISASLYCNVPLGNLNDGLLDIMLLREMQKNNSFCDNPGEESILLFKSEKCAPGFYEKNCVMFECVGSLILSVLEYRTLLSESSYYQNANRFDLCILSKFIKKIIFDFSNNDKGAAFILNKLNSWIKKDSKILSTGLRDIINLVHQRYLFNLIANLNKFDINVVFASKDVLCVETEKNDYEGCNRFFEYLQKKISEIDGYEFLSLRLLNQFDKLLFINPNRYFYKRNDLFFSFSDVKIPSDYIRKYFENDLVCSSYVYDLITKVDKDVAKTIIQTLDIRNGYEVMVSNSYKLLKLNEYEKESLSSIEISITCNKCNLENVLRKRCIKCGEFFPRDYVNKSVLRYFFFTLNLELSAETFCSKCRSINKKRIADFCVCGGFFKKKNHKKDLYFLLQLINNESLKSRLKSLLIFYNISKQ